VNRKSNFYYTINQSEWMNDNLKRVLLRTPRANLTFVDSIIFFNILTSSAISIFISLSPAALFYDFCFSITCFLWFLSMAVGLKWYSCLSTRHQNLVVWVRYRVGSCRRLTMVLAACLTWCSALMGECKATVHARHCHWLATALLWKQPRSAHGASKRRWGVRRPLVTLRKECN